MTLEQLTEIYGLINLPEGDIEFKKIPLDFIDAVQEKYDMFDEKKLELLHGMAEAVEKDGDAHDAFSWLVCLIAKRAENERVKVKKIVENPLLQMAAYFSVLYYVARAVEFLKNRGVSDGIVRDSIISPYARSVQITEEGGLYFDVLRLYSWSQIYIDAKLLRIGVLNFELRDKVKYECDGMLGPDDAVINVHIPVGAKITPENCEKSYRECAELVKRVFPEFKFKAFVCFSWMMDKQLKDMLPPESNIIRFQSRYHTFFRDMPTDGVLVFVFGYPAGVRPDYSELPEDTSLRRNIKAHLIAGGSIYADGGIFFDY